METYNILFTLNSSIFKRLSSKENIDIKKIFEECVKNFNGNVISFFLMIGGEYNCTTIIEVKDKIKLASLILELKKINYLDNYKVNNLFSNSEFKKFIKDIKG